MRGALLSLVLLLAVAGAAHADERILSWRSDVRVRPDSTLEVTETLHVRAEGQQIRRGILRDFPTRYVDRRGRRVVTGFTVLAVRRDGRPEPFATERLRNGIRVRIGDADVFLAPGEYEYTIAYRTDRQLGFFPDYDELYWNVTGNGWDFPIDSVAADVFLPGGIPAETIDVEAYTGRQGAQGRDWSASADASHASFRTTRGLAPREGLTIVATWPKGHVMAPGLDRRAAYVLRDAWPAFLAVTALALVLWYYLARWHRVGRDPPARVTVPQYEPPAGISPAAMRFLRRMGYDDRCFAAGILSLAVQGALRIEQQSTGFLKRAREFALQRTSATPPATLSDDERPLYEALFAGRERLELDNANHALINSAKRAHQRSLEQRHTPGSFRSNRGWHAVGLALTLLSGLLVVAVAVRSGFGASWWLLTPAGWIALGAAACAVLANVVFGRLLKAPTLAGRAIMDHVEGFRLYLDVAEGDELRMLDAPPLTLKLYERFLPAALALGVEQRWAERFAGVLATEAVAGTPAWYSGHAWDGRNIARFTSGFSDSLSGAIASASKAPGSSSGRGGGGSSGGGGGGGGGGGW